MSKRRREREGFFNGANVLAGSMSRDKDLGWTVHSADSGRDLLRSAECHSPTPIDHSNRAQLGGSGVLTLPIMYIFDDEPRRWHSLLETLNLAPADVPVQ